MIKKKTIDNNYMKWSIFWVSQNWITNGIQGGQKLQLFISLAIGVGGIDDSIDVKTFK